MKSVVLAAVAVAFVTAASRPIPPVARHHPLAGQAIDAKALYTDLCKKCHGVLGTPPQTMKKKYTKIATFDAKFLESHSVDSIVTILTKGKGEDMESVKDKVSADEMKAIAAYVRELAARPKPGGDE